MTNDVVLVAVGCLTGVLAGMLGAGGGFATVALLLAAGAAPHVAVGTALVYMMVMGGWGTFMHVHVRSVDRRLAVEHGTASGITAHAAAKIAEAMSGRHLVLALGLFTACVSGVSLAWPQTRRPVELAYDAVADALAADAIAAGDEEAPVGGTAPAGRPGSRRGRSGPGTVGPVPVTGPRPVPTAAGPATGDVGVRLGGAVIGGSIIGLLKGLFGVGGGFLIVPVMSRVGRVPREVAVGSSLFAILVASVVAALRHWTLGNIDGSDLLALVPGGLFGAFVGARAARSMSPASIRRVFLAVMAASTVYLLLLRSSYR
ncbi:MAG: uncharacterized protein QOD57_1652 [Actinomycetota bacterium]|nr:uncharacterized protein [Actinomycetota bacterium]